MSVWTQSRGKKQKMDSTDKYFEDLTFNAGEPFSRDEPDTRRSNWWLPKENKESTSDKISKWLKTADIRY